MKRIFHSKISPVLKMQTSDIHFVGSKDPGRRTMFVVSFFCMGIFFILILIRLFNLTVVKGNYYHRLSESNRIREVPIEPKYGEIRDRKWFLLAENKDANLSSSTNYIRSERIYY
ncbi:hypothetical protein COV87_02840, partial [Candidatus Roizmanbacteria bacterium CG11_big_fil_rev_8_21_14_0_20_37_16]